jgi:hypothetical protein
MIENRQTRHRDAQKAKRQLVKRAILLSSMAASFIPESMEAEPQTNDEPWSCLTPSHVLVVPFCRLNQTDVTPD